MNKENQGVLVIGAGLAGSEAAWQLVQRKIPVTLYEMRPKKMTPAHQTQDFAELVCSNSLRADKRENAVGLLKEEMRQLNSLIIACADACRVPAGGALAVDRHRFSQMVTERLTSHPLLTLRREEVKTLPAAGVAILATGPLTSAAMAQELQALGGDEQLYFYDAAAPLVAAESLDETKGFWASRYDKGEKDYFNCPLTKEEYDSFYQALVKAKVTPARNFEKEIFFEGCMPVEVLAARGPQTLLFGPLKPVGLINPTDGRRPYGVVQLRQDDQACTLMNMVGFQTRLTRSEQKRVFQMIPALAGAEFVRYGMVHRNTYLNAPELLLPDGRLRVRPHIFVAGQMTGVEGYVESAASGLACGINAARLFAGRTTLLFPQETALGSLLHYIVAAQGPFQPMNVNFGLLPDLAQSPREKRERNGLLAERALAALAQMLPEVQE